MESHSTTATGRGRRRSSAVTSSPRGKGVGTFSAWPLEAVDNYPAPARDTDPWVRLVREGIELYRTGRSESARQMWADDIVWSVAGDGPVSGQHIGADAIFGYHTRLSRLAGGEFRQRLLAIEGSGGPVVTAYLWTQARRGDDVHEIPTLVFFEVSRMRVRRVTEMPGDQAAWDRFWSD